MVLNRMLRLSVSMLAFVTIGAGALRAQGRGRGAVLDSAFVDSTRARVRVLVDLLGRSLQPGPVLYGMALECTNCKRILLPPDSALMRTLGDTVVLARMPLNLYRVPSMPLTAYSERPRVTALAPGGSAERAGVLVGDTLIAVNGKSILSSEGAREFSVAHIGDNMTLTLRRDGKNVDVTITLRTPEGRGGRGGLPADRYLLPLRFPGQVGTMPVEVMSDTPLTVEMDPSGDLVIHVQGTTVRVHPR